MEFLWEQIEKEIITTGRPALQRVSYQKPTSPCYCHKAVLCFEWQMKRFGLGIAEMNAGEVLNTVIYSDDDFDWNESSAESSEDDEDDTLNLLDPLSS